MISFLTGKVIKNLSNGIILDVCGVGYELSVTLPHLAAIINKKNEVHSFWVYTKVREDALNLFGFSTWEERTMFAILIQISGVGPKVAMAILSTIDMSTIVDAVDHEESEILSQVPGIGKRTAEKILLELKAKREKIPHIHNQPNFDIVTEVGSPKPLFNEPNEILLKNKMSREMRSDLYSALENLGFKEKDISPVLKVIHEEFEDESFSDLVKKSLTLISPKQNKHIGSSYKGNSKRNYSKNDVSEFKRMF